MLSQTVEYALRASIHIARHDSDCLRVPEIADAIGAPRTYLAKILGQLARAGLLESTRGPLGGFRLALPPDRVPLAAIVSVFSSTQPRRCLIGHGRCGSNPCCTVHQGWVPIAKAMEGFFANTTLADLLKSPAPPPADSRRVGPVLPIPILN